MTEHKHAPEVIDAAKADDAKGTAAGAIPFMVAIAIGFIGAMVLIAWATGATF